MIFTALSLYFCLQRVYTVGGEETLSALRTNHAKRCCVPALSGSSCATIDWSHWIHHPAQCPPKVSPTTSLPNECPSVCLRVSRGSAEGGEGVYAT